MQLDDDVPVAEVVAVVVLVVGLADFSQASIITGSDTAPMARPFKNFALDCFILKSLKQKRAYQVVVSLQNGLIDEPALFDDTCQPIEKAQSITQNQFRYCRLCSGCG
jgi:hypothetical protein